MFNYLIQRTLKKIALKVVTDEEFRRKLKKTINHGLNTAKLQKKEGSLIKILGKKAGRIKNKIKHLK